MDVASWGYQGPYYLGLPAREAGYLLITAYLLLNLVFLRRHRHFRITFPSYAIASALLAGSLLLSGLLTIQFSAGGEVAAPGQPLEPSGPAFPLLGAVPWMLAAGFLGEPHAMLVALIAGLARGGWMTQRLITPIAIVAQAAVFAWLVRRPYLEWPGRLARRPLASALVIAVIFGVLRSLEDFVYSGGDFYAALDYAALRVGPSLRASIVELGFAGLIAEGARASYASLWYAPPVKRIGPYNRSLAARLVTVVASLGLVGGTALTYGNWLLARSSAQEILATQMQQTAEQASEGIPFFIQSGRSQIREIAQSVNDDNLEAAISETGQASTYFNRLAVLDPSGAVATQWPQSAVPVSLEVVSAARTGIPQEITVRSSTDGSGVNLVFLAPLATREGTVAGWTDLARNPLLQPVVARISGFSPGEATVVDGRSHILIHADPERLLEQVDPTPDREFVYASTAAGGRSLMYSLPVEGYPWQVIISIPQRTIDALALSTTFNLLILLVAIGSVVIIGVQLMSSRLTRPLRQMAATAESIARGDLDQEVSATGDDEIGRLSSSFEGMRLSLKARLDELNLLLSTSRRMSESFDLGEALPAVLSKIRDLTGAEVVRLVRSPSNGTIERYSIGDSRDDWAKLDSDVLQLSRVRGKFALENPSRAKAVLDLDGLSDPIESLVAVPVAHEGRFQGVLWLAHRKPRSFSKGEDKLLAIFAGQLGISLANVGLYQRVERERSRLVTILDSTPDAVIVTDSKGSISLANPAAEAVLSLRSEEAVGRPIEEATGSEELIALLKSPVLTDRSIEIKGEGGRVWYASASEVPGGQMGRVCVLSDITQYKILDSLKSEFVSTVSHDLRGPLTLMRGYTTMLSNVGAVNEQQQELQEKVLRSVDRMTKLVDDLLDLGRIETGIGLTLEPVALTEILQDVLSNYRPQALNKQVTLEVDLSPNMELVHADPMLIRQAIANLVDNGIKYTEPGGRVIVSAEQVDGRQIIQVKDTGVGIAPADQPRLFEKFFRVGEAKGSGLGLAIVKSIVEQHHGRVSVDSRLGSGSRFTIAFPMLGELRRVGGRAGRS
jgi:PAS domain S-box-containing protein